MRRRLYFLLPDVERTTIVHNELLLARIEERRMHILAKEGIDLRDLPEAGLRQKTDIVHGLQMGGLIGAFTGAILSSLVFAMDMIVPGWEVWTVGSIFLGGAFMGAWASSMIAVNVRNTRLKKFEPEIEAGKILFMVDVPVQRLDEITQLVHSQHPEAEMRGIDPTIPAFP